MGGAVGRPLHTPVLFATGGLSAYPQTTLEPIDRAVIAPQGYCFPIDMLRWVAK
jgi:hypothetical protein